MCLYTKQSEAKRVTLPILCYKVVIIIDDKVYAPIYTNYKYGVINKCYYFKRTLKEIISESAHEKENIFIKLIKKIFSKDELQIVNYGFHTYKDEDVAKAAKESMEKSIDACRYPNVALLVVSCTIPTGAFYYEGKINDTENIGYCSDSLNIPGARSSEGCIDNLGPNYILASMEFKNQKYKISKDTIVLYADTKNMINNVNYHIGFKFAGCSTWFYTDLPTSSIREQIKKDFPEYDNIKIVDYYAEPKYDFLW